MINCINCNEFINVSEKDLTCPICGVLQNITETQVDYFSTHYKQSKKFGKLSEETIQDKKRSRAKPETIDLNTKIINVLINIRNLLETSCKVLVNKYNVHYVVEEYVKYLYKLYINSIINTISMEDGDNTDNNRDNNKDINNTTAASNNYLEQQIKERNKNNKNLSIYGEIKREGVYMAIVILYIGLNKYYYKINLNNIYNIVYVLGVVKNKISKNMRAFKIYKFINSINTNNNNNNINSNDNGKRSKDDYMNNNYDHNKIIMDKYNNINNNYKLSLRLLCRRIIKYFKLPSILYTILDRLIDYYYYHYNLNSNNTSNYNNTSTRKDNNDIEENESIIGCALVLILCRLIWPIFHFQPPSFPYRAKQQHASDSSFSNTNTTGNSTTSKRKNRNNKNINETQNKNYRNKWNTIKLVTTPDNHRVKVLEFKKYIIDNYKNANFNSFVISIIYKYTSNYLLMFKLLPIFNSLNTKNSNSNNNKLYYDLLDIDFSLIDGDNSNTNASAANNYLEQQPENNNNNNNKTNNISSSNIDNKLNLADYSNSEIYYKILNSYNNNICFSGYSFEKSLEFSYFIFFTKKFKNVLFKNISNLISNINDSSSDINNIYNPVINKLISSFENKILQQYNDNNKRRKTGLKELKDREKQTNNTVRNVSDTINNSTTDNIIDITNNDNNKNNDKEADSNNRNNSNNNSNNINSNDNSKRTSNKLNILEYEQEKIKKLFQQFPCITRTGHTLPLRTFNLGNSSYHGLPILYLLLLKSVSNLMGVPSYKVHWSVVNIESILISSINNN